MCDCTSDTEPVAPTVSDLWPAANWHERETYDLLGITFSKHPDLRRILMWDGYPYHPLRKDFPLLARRIKPWPGIVDVEQMPGDDEPEEAAAED